MILRVTVILLSGLATWALWFSFGQLKLLRGTPLWEFRYFLFLLAAFLGLSALEWAVGRVKKMVQGE